MYTGEGSLKVVLDPPPPHLLLKFAFPEKIQESVIDQSRIVPAPSL